jgi:hypothetical protein
MSCCGSLVRHEAGGGTSGPVLPLGDEGEFGQSDGGMWVPSEWTLPETVTEGELGAVLTASAAGVSTFTPLFQRSMMVSFGARQISATLIWLYPWNFDSAAANATTVAGYQIPPMMGRIKNMRVHHTTLIVSTDNIVYTLVKNNTTDTALTVTLNTNTANGTDLVNVVDLLATDLLSVKAVGATATRASRVSVQFDLEF